MITKSKITVDKITQHGITQGNLLVNMKVKCHRVRVKVQFFCSYYRAGKSARLFRNHKNLIKNVPKNRNKFQNATKHREYLKK